MKQLVNRRVLLIAGVAVASLAPAYAANILTNGDFSSNGGPGQLTVNTTLTAWTGGGREGSQGSQTTPPVFVFNGSPAGSNGDAFMGNVSFYGSPTSPTSGDFIGADGDSSYAGSISQTVSGLTVGDSYELDFTWAGAQQLSFSGDTTEKWQVSFGTDTQDTATVDTPSQTFVGWQNASLDFTAGSASELLTFLAVGTPNGEPSWLLLNNVSMADVTSPEPASAALILGGIGLVIALGRLKKRA